MIFLLVESAMHTANDSRRYIIHSDELLSAFLELEQTLL